MGVIAALALYAIMGTGRQRLTDEAQQNQSVGSGVDYALRAVESESSPDTARQAASEHGDSNALQAPDGGEEPSAASSTRLQSTTPKLVEHGQAQNSDSSLASMELHPASATTQEQKSNQETSKPVHEQQLQQPEPQELQQLQKPQIQERQPPQQQVQVQSEEAVVLEKDRQPVEEVRPLTRHTEPQPDLSRLREQGEQDAASMLAEASRVRAERAIQDSQRLEGERIPKKPGISNFVIKEPLCEDTNQLCGDWAHAGECDANQPFMHHSCRFSCGLCKQESGQDPLDRHQPDQHVRCADWANSGECEKNAAYMAQKCSRSCALQRMNLRRVP